MKQLLIFSLLAMSLSCKMVSVYIAEEGEKPRKILVPFKLVKTAVRFTDAKTIEIDDLGGFSTSIDLYALAEAMREDGSKVDIEFTEEDTTIRAKKQGQLFKIEMTDDYEESHLTLNLPLALMDMIASADAGTVETKELMNSFKKFSGVLLELDSPDEKIKIMLR